MPRELVVRHIVPGTDITITIERRPPDPDLARILKDRSLEKEYFYIARSSGTATFVNMLSTGRATEAEARQEANFLWKDSVMRRNAANYPKVTRSPEFQGIAGDMWEEHKLLNS